MTSIQFVYGYADEICQHTFYGMVQQSPNIMGNNIINDALPVQFQWQEHHKNCTVQSH